MQSFFEHIHSRLGQHPPLRQDIPLAKQRRPGRNEVTIFCETFPFEIAELSAILQAMRSIEEFMNIVRVSASYITANSFNYMIKLYFCNDLSILVESLFLS